MTTGVEALVRGAIVGFSIAAPVGPICLLCVRRALAEGTATGFASGLGAATADALYGAVAGFGLTAISGALIAWRGGFELVGGCAMLWLAWTTARSRPAERAAVAGGRGGLFGAWLSTFSLTVVNPATILTFAAVFGGLGLAGEDASRAGALVGGVFLGSTLWWAIVSLGVGAFRTRITPGVMVWVNRLSGAILGGFGLIALADLAGRPASFG